MYHSWYGNAYGFCIYNCSFINGAHCSETWGACIISSPFCVLLCSSFFCNSSCGAGSLHSSGIAEADAVKTGFRAFGFTIGGFIIPYVIVSDPALLLEGPAYWVAWVIFTTALGIYVLSCSVTGWFFTNATIVERIAGVIGALCLIIPAFLTDIVGLSICAFVLYKSYRKAKKNKDEHITQCVSDTVQL